MSFTSRALPLGLVALVWLAVPAVAQQSWTADDAVARALESLELDAMLTAQLEATRAELDEATERDLPSLSLEHEQLLVDPSPFELTASVEAPFDLSGWRGDLRSGLSHREDVLRAAVQQRELEVAAEVRRAFYAVRYHQRRLDALARWIARIDEGVGAMIAREDRGDASLYEVAQIQSALDVARATRAVEASQLDGAWTALESWVSWQRRPALSGELTPESPAVETSLADLPDVSLPHLLQLEHLELALAAERSAWGAPGLRDWSIEAGYRYADEGGGGAHGFMAALSIPLAFWNPDAPRLARIGAERQVLLGRLEVERELALRRERAVSQRLSRSLEALAELGGDGDDYDLIRLAEAAYAADEATLYELLDAYGSAAELHLSRIDLQWEARQAAIELARLRGTGD